MCSVRLGVEGRAVTTFAPDEPVPLQRRLVRALLDVADREVEQLDRMPGRKGLEWAAKQRVRSSPDDDAGIRSVHDLPLRAVRTSRIVDGRRGRQPDGHRLGKERT